MVFSLGLLDIFSENLKIVKFRTAPEKPLLLQQGWDVSNDFLKIIA